ncbi:NAD(P)H-dependent glycerol-3-phosphate dehydrogenase [Blochmannia endosymbiont of Colobopsis nipponica]|uniref:NAD(P)H-dependent glycerol-3-phosphate dehydrogenase n=1 Tax=Blochmannia endosymbiont of Colobopsis nipponica TaxID=2681987 RepID=UPI00177EE1E1|nr:NAD(P)H-dependent glycerol-3-phosphate dehydrogenase [Blochmannia endosymbiont of Colobopsis nipponica]QOI10870.1 NAD(P)H-dependent glycerol-3-phosphate dehydrogenase [Blochmannia endosymbiont of Colobopsis nipponica]
MISSISSVVIIGAGAYGTALGIMLAKNGHKVFLWGHNPIRMRALKINRFHHHFVPDLKFPKLLFVEDSLQVALSVARDIIIAVPSNVFNSVLIKLKPHLRFDSRIILATKGLESKTGRFLQDVTREILGQEIPLAIISGPTFAKEIAMGLPTAIVVVSNNSLFIKDLENLLKCNNHFMVFIHSDFVGIQLTGVVKNIVAIASGISDGVGFGANARIALITCGFAEMLSLGLAMGGKLSLFTGMAGLGDLVLTCTDNQSRNRRFGILLGQGVGVSNAIKKVGQVVEGFNNTKEVRILSHQYNVVMPIVEQIYQILYHDKDVREAAFCLMKLSV